MIYLMVLCVASANAKPLVYSIISLGWSSHRHYPYVYAVATRNTDGFVGCNERSDLHRLRIGKKRDENHTAQIAALVAPYTLK